MRIPRLTLAVLAAALCLTAARSGATITDGTYWYCDAAETLKVSGFPKSTDSFSGVTLDFDGMGNVQVYLPDPDEFYNGTVVAKGKNGFLIVPDATAVNNLRGYVADRVLYLAGADSVDITSFGFTIKGKVRDGELKAVLKAKGKGSITLGGRTRKGAGKLTEKLVSQIIT